MPTDDKKLLVDCGLVGCHSSRSNDLSVHARIDSTGYVRLLWESSEEDDKNSHAAILEFGKKAEAEPRERTADSLISDLESVALAVEGSDLNTTEGNFVPTARCIQHTKERQLVTRSGLQRPRCCVCHLHHWRAMNAPVSVKQFIKTVLQQVHHFEVDVIAGDANAAAYKYNKRQENQELHSLSVAIMLREMRREVNTGRPLESRLHIDYSTNNHFSQRSSASDLDCCFMAILSWRKPPGPSIMRKLWSNLRKQTQGNEKRQVEDNSYCKTIEGLLRATARKIHPEAEDVDNPMIAPQDYDVRQSGRVLELRNRSLDTTNRSVLVFSYSCDHS